MGRSVFSAEFKREAVKLAKQVGASKARDWRAHDGGLEAGQTEGTAASLRPG